MGKSVNRYGDYKTYFNHFIQSILLVRYTLTLRVGDHAAAIVNIILVLDRLRFIYSKQIQFHFRTHFIQLPIYINLHKLYKKTMFFTAIVRCTLQIQIQSEHKKKNKKKCIKNKVHDLLSKK